MTAVQSKSVKASMFLLLFFVSVSHSRDSECYSQDMEPLACHIYGQTRQIPKSMKGMAIVFSNDCYDRNGKLKLIPYSCRGVNDYVEVGQTDCVRKDKGPYGALYTASVECRNGKGWESILRPVKKFQSTQEMNSWFIGGRK